MLAVIIAVILCLSLLGLFGRLTSDYAARRGRSKGAWFVWGALFYPAPYIVLALLPPRRRDNAVLPD